MQSGQRKEKKVERACGAFLALLVAVLGIARAAMPEIEEFRSHAKVMLDRQGRIGIGLAPGTADEVQYRLCLQPGPETAEKLGRVKFPLELDRAQVVITKLPWAVTIKDGQRTVVDIRIDPDAAQDLRTSADTVLYRGPGPFKVEKGLFGKLATFTTDEVAPLVREK
jgi:hypothetical protein